MSNVSSNLTNDTFLDEDEYYMDDLCPMSKRKTQLEYVAKITMYVSIIVTSLVGNILIISVTRRTRSMQKVAFHFVVNMAIADLLTTLINIPDSLSVEIRDSSEWMITGDFGIVLCKLLPFCQEVCAFCSILSLLAIALDRFFAICLPLKRIMTKRLSKVIIVSTWLIPCISSAPMFVANIVVEDQGQLFCVEEWPAPLDTSKASRDYTITLFVLFYILPLIIISTLYSCVVYKIWRRRAPGNRSMSTTRLFTRSRKKALKMFISIVFCFAICWLPYHVTFFLMSYDEDYYNCGIPEDAYFVSQFFSHSISALNPCIYMISNKDYRTGIKRLLASRTRRSDAVYALNDTCTNVDTRTGVNEDQEMTTFYSQTPQRTIRDLTHSKLQHKIGQNVPARNAFVVKFNLGLTG